LFGLKETYVLQTMRRYFKHKKLGFHCYLYIALSQL
jgi:hypothetical protein